LLLKKSWTGFGEGVYFLRGNSRDYLNEIYENVRKYAIQRNTPTPSKDYAISN